jgi:hypothetical protein
MQLRLGLPATLILLAALILFMSTILKALSLRSYGAGVLSSMYCAHNFSMRANCEKLSAPPVPPSNNPLLKRDSTPRFAEITTEHVLPAVEYDLKKLSVDFSGSNVATSCVHVLLHKPSRSLHLTQSWKNF